MTIHQTPETDLTEQFAYHRPPNDGVGQRHEAVRAAALELAQKLIALTPDTRERERALECCREAMFWANAGIACHPLAPVGDTSKGAGQ